MKTLLSTLVLLAATVLAGSPADEAGVPGEVGAPGAVCRPAEAAARQGYKAMDEFHQVLAPIWHKSWPEKDYDALLAAGPQFAEKFKAVAALEPKFKLESRTEKFNHEIRCYLQ